MRPHLAIGLLSISLSLVALNVAHSESWSRFRGPNGSGVAVGNDRLPEELGPETNVLWKTELPPGHSSPVLTAERIFVTAVEDGRLFTIGLNRANGRILWKREAKHAGLEIIHSIGSHAQPTPVTDGELVISFFGSSGMFCYDLDGTLLWERPLGPFKNTYGAASSPVIVDDLVFTCQDHDIDSFLMALDKRTGEPVWTADRGEFPRGFSSPAIWNVNGKTQLVAVGALRAIGYDFKTGEKLWTVRGLARISNAIPVIGDDNVLYISEWAPGGDDTNRIEADPFADTLKQFDKNGNAAIEVGELPAGPLKSRFPQIDRDKDGEISQAEYDWMREIFHAARNSVVAVKPGGEGDITETHVLWTQKKLIPYVPSPLYYGGHIFLVKNGGIVSCLDAKTGQSVKQGRIPKTKSYYSSPVAGDDKVYLINQRGELTVLSAESDWKVLSTADFEEETFATPAISAGRIYLRTAGSLYCFGLEASAGR
jgi:outer membrane protein assembly factor BamB